MTTVKELLTYAVEHKASDLHLSPDMPPIIRVDGDLMPVENTPVLSDTDIYSMLNEALPKDQMERFKNVYEMDLSLEISELARFRVNVFQQLSGVSAAFRTIPFKILSLDDLGMPTLFKDLCTIPNGLILMTGPTGHGKSTTLAAVIDHINNTQNIHINTIEDPIEFVYQNKQCLIQQRELYQHTDSFGNALRAALREDTDVILVGEMRDLDTIRLALTAAETGHLVFATLHTNSAATTVNRIIDVFPAGEKDLVRSMLVSSLRAVISQILVKKKGGGRVAAQEIMMCNLAIRNLIREDKIPQIQSTIQTSQSTGMRTLAQHLCELSENGIIDEALVKDRLASIRFGLGMT